MIFVCLSFMFLVFTLCGVSLCDFRVSAIHVAVFILRGVSLRAVRVPAWRIFLDAVALQLGFLPIHGFLFVLMSL